MNPGNPASLPELASSKFSEEIELKNKVESIERRQAKMISTFHMHIYRKVSVHAHTYTHTQSQRQRIRETDRDRKRQRNPSYKFYRKM